MLENIFNIYDYDGDGYLNEEEYLTFISDIVYISVLMKRVPESEYRIENVKLIAAWSSANFKTNLFRVPLPTISHDLFMNGIMYALTENQQFPIFQNNRIFVISFVPELIHYFHYYVDVAKRRGWPTELEMDTGESEVEMDTGESEEKEVEMDTGEMEIEMNTGEMEVVDTRESEEKEADVDTGEKENTENTFTNQVVEYQDRRRKKYQEEKELERQKHQQVLAMRHEEQDRINQELFLQQQQLEANQRERERRNLEEENRRRQLLLLQQLQTNLREHIRQHVSIDQLSTTLPDIGTIEIKESDEGYDPIEGNIRVLTFLKNNTEDGIVFRCGDSYYLASKDRIRSMIQSGEKDNSLFYGCMCEIEGDWTQP